MQPDPDLDPISAQLQAEEQQLRRRSILLTVIPVLIAGVLIWVTARQVNNATQELQQVEAARDDASDSLHKAEAALLDITAERIRLHREVDSLQIIKDELFAQWERSNKGAADMAQEEAIKTYEGSKSQPRVYLHITSKDQLAKARRVQQQLEAAGFVVPGIEVVSWRSEESVLRVFREADLRTARRIQAVAKQHRTALTLQDLSARYAQSQSSLSEHFEIWFGQDF